MKRRTLLGLIPALVVAACGDGGDIPRFQNEDLSPRDIFPSGKLQGADGRPVDLADFRGNTLILFFGYTSCPDFCPSTLRKYASLVRNLRGRDADRVKVIFISVDPERDSPEKADSYAKWFNPNFIGLTGNNEQIASIARQFSVIYAKQPVDGQMGYVIDHSTAAYLVDQRGKLRLSFAEKTMLEPIAGDLQKILAEK